jgi:hypothetical protein
MLLLSRNIKKNITSIVERIVMISSWSLLVDILLLLLFQVTVHLRGGAVAKGRLLYHQKHYNLAFFRVKMHQSIQLPHFIDKVECAQDIFELGRDESVKLVIHHGRVKYSNPDVYERNHHMRIEGPHRDREVHMHSTRVIATVFLVLYSNGTSNNITNSNVVV